MEGVSSYNEKCDLWSIGVITYFMLSGLPPFLGNTETAVKIKILSGDYSFDNKVWLDISEDAQGFIMKLLE